MLLQVLLLEGLTSKVVGRCRSQIRLSDAGVAAHEGWFWNLKLWYERSGVTTWEVKGRNELISSCG